MTTIYKYPFPTTDKFTLNMPAGAEILTVQMQQETSCVWALVDTEAEKTPRVFEVIGTGHQIDTDYERKYIGTYQMYSGALVFHLFEI